MKKLITIMVILLLMGGCSARDTTSGNNTDIEKSKSYSSMKEEKESNSAEEIKSVSADEALKLIELGDLVILDVRSNEGYIEGHIENAQNIPLKELEEKQLELDKSNKYLMVCKTGKTSEEASKLLVQNGYENVYNLKGGMDGWTGEIVKQ